MNVAHLKRLCSAVGYGVVFSTLTACASHRDWVATGGSRSDGVVRLSYEDSEFLSTRVDESQAVGLATQRCKAWGYQSAEAFGGVLRQCNGYGIGCVHWMVTKEYQCTGAPAPTGR